MKERKDADEVRNQYLRGRRFIERRERTIERSDLNADVWKSLAKGQPARELIEEIAFELGVTYDVIMADVKLAEAVDIIVANCGEAAHHVMFDRDRPQTPKAITTLSRTADTRQKHRIEGVHEGRFRSIAPQNDDAVYDTVSFAEVPSRLRRARGALQKLRRLIAENGAPAVAKECSRLAELCGRAAKELWRQINSKSVGKLEVPRQLCKEAVWPILRSRKFQGETVGKARLALRLTIKSVWDSPEMRRRGIVPTEKELERTKTEIDRIVAITELICWPRRLQASHTTTDVTSHKGDG